jgi:hypothetical protein
MCFAACQKTPEPELSVSKNEFSLDARGGYISVSVTTNVKVSVNIQGSWITQDGSSDGGSGTYGFKVDFNEGYDSRTGSITFSNSESGVSQIVSVTQAQQDVIIPGSNEYSLFYEAQTFSLPVSSNVDFTVSVDGGDWIKSLGTRGISKKELQFSIAENAGKEPREATITVTAGALKQIIKVEQLATTHRPETKEQWVESVNLNKDISNEKAEVFKQLDEEGITDVNEMADALAEIDGVIDVVPNSDGSIISIMQRDSIWMDIYLDTPQINSISVSNTPEANPLLLSKLENPTRGSSITPLTRASDNNTIIKKEGKALILSPFQWELKYPTEDWADILSEHFSSVLLLQNPTESTGSASIDYFKGDVLDDYDFIIIATHGGFAIYQKPVLGGEKTVEINTLVSGTLYSEEKAEELSKSNFMVRTGSSRNTKNTYFAMTPNYLDHSSFNNTAVILAACSSAKTRTMVDKFRDKGASFVSGFEHVTNTWVCEQYIDNMLLFLSSSLSYKDAHDLSAKSNLAKKVTDLCMTNYSEIKDDKTEISYYDLSNVTSIFPETSKKEFYFSDPHPVLKAPDKNNPNFSWTCSLSPCLSFWTYLYDFYKDPDSGEELSYTNYFECEYSVAYSLYIDGKEVKRTTDKSAFINNLAVGSHKAYVVAEFIMDPEFAVKYPSKDVSYKSNEVSFNIEGEAKFVKMATGNALVITSNNAVVPFVSESNWKPMVSQIGVVYSTTNSVPTINSSDCLTKTTGETSLGASSVQLTGLNPKTLYYCRAYILLQSGDVFYGSVTKFTTTEEVKKPAISVDMTSLVFADTKVGEKSTASFVITNTGSANLTVSLSGAGGVYSMDWTSGTINPNGGSQKVTVTFSPNKAADFTTSIKISSNAGSDKTISLSGKGISAVEKTAKIEVSKTELKFEDKKQGESATLSFTIRNTGTADLKVAVSDPGAPFSVSWNEKTIAPNGRETLSVVFAPNKVADFNAKLQISSNATNGTKYLTLTGKGILDPNTGGDEQKPVISFSSTSLTFTSVMVGETGTQTITVSNTGTKALKINKITCPSGFSSSWSSKTIAAKGSEPLTITFAPTSAKTYSGDLVIESDASNGTSKIILLSGTGTAKPEPKLSVSTTDLNFGNQVCFSQESKTITITNSGTGALNISSITKTNNYGSLFTLSGWTSGGTITAGASKTITVSFQPIEQRTYEETLTIVSSNATNNKTQTIRLRGTGSPEPENPVLNFSTSSLSFGDVEVGESSTKSFTITNTGTTVLNISSIKIVANDNTQNPSYYSITPSDACTIAANKSKSFSVTFSPEAVRSYGATISITSNATNATQGTSILNISGTGIKATSKILTASPSSLSFGMQTVGNRTHKNFTVTNSGTKAVTLYSMEATDGFIVDQTWAEGNTLGLAAGASKTFSAYFAPTQTKAYNGQIVIKSNASNGDLVIPLSGTGAEAQGYIEIISGQTMDFGNVNVGTSGSLSAKIKNSGEASMRILSIDCPDGFSATCNVSSVSAGYNTTVNVFFTPTLAKSYSGTVVIHTDAENETAEIDVSGVGKPTISTETFVDMGVSVKWASKNVGASRPEDYGHYVAWGEVSTKTQYLYNNYKWYVGDAVFSGGGYITKYCTSPEPYGYQGFSNPLKMLAYEDDYAQAKLKGLARTPTRKEWEELKKNSDWVWTQENGINGYLVTSKITGNSIFLPAGGSIEYSNKEVNEVGYYWTSDLNHEESYATTWEIRSNKPWYSYRQRYIGLNVRAVEDDTAKPMIYFSTGKLSFTGTKIGTTVSKNMTIKNIGKGTLTISKVSTSSRFSPSWTSATIEPGESKTLTVSYTPVYDPNLVIEDELTWDSTTLNFTTNARNENSYTIYLEGYGVE